MPFSTQAIRWPMTDVVSLSAARAKPVDEIVERCEWLLKNAQDGTLRELAFVTKMDKSGGYDNWASCTDDFAAQLGQVHRLAHRLQRAADRLMNDGRGE